MGQTRSRLQRVLSAGDFPAEILTGVPVVELKGGEEAVVICHRGVLAYGPEEVRVATAIGPLRILGRDLRIFRMNRERIVLHGRIRALELGGEEPC